MNSNELYEELKAAWDFLGVGFHGRHLVSTWIDGEHLVLDYLGKQVRIKV